MKAASTDDRFQDDKKGGPILTEGGIFPAILPGGWGPGGPIHAPGRLEDGAGGPPSSRSMGPGGGGRSKGGPQNFMSLVKYRLPNWIRIIGFHPITGVALEYSHLR